MEINCFNEKIFFDLKKIEQFKCLINKGVLNNPVYDSCGHLFCKLCLDEYLETNEKCPISGFTLKKEHVQDALPIRLIVDGLTVKCPKECGHIGILS